MKFTVDRSRSIISAMILGRKVTAMDVAWLRREVSPRAKLPATPPTNCLRSSARGRQRPEWTELFVEMITEHVVWQSRPTGVVSEAQAEWLIERCDACASVNALAVLVNVLGEAHRAPRWFLAAVRARAAKGWSGVEEALKSSLAG